MLYIVYSNYLYDSDGGFDVLFVNDNFIKYFCLKDRNSNALDNIFLNDYGDCVPIILGRVYQGQYDVGDKIEVEGATLQVAAFLEKNSYYYNLS